MDYSSLLAVILAIVGLALIIAEIFIPSGGMIMIGAVLCFVGSIWCAWGAWGERPAYFWSYIGVLLLLLPAVTIAALYYIPRTEFGRRILLEAQSLEEVTPFADEEAFLSQLIGSTGKTLSLMNPGGLVLINHERMHCESQGMLIEPNTEVEVVGVRGNRLVVRVPFKSKDLTKTPKTPEKSPVEESGPPEKLPSPEPESPKEFVQNAEDPPLDFDIPQS